MSLLFGEDYEFLRKSGLEFEEDEAQRFLIIKNFPLQTGLYAYNGNLLNQVEVLWVIPPNYNTSGGDMFWVHPALARADGKPIPAAAAFGGGDPRHFKGKEYCRWSRHWPDQSWKPKEDNIVKILNRIEWALKRPDANK